MDQLEEYDAWNIENLVQTIDNQLGNEQTSDLLEMKKEIDNQLTYDIQKTIIRYLYVIIDNSSSMKLKDIKPSRLACSLEFMRNFVESFYDKNPLSVLGIGVMKECKMMQLSDMVQHPREHFKNLDLMKESESNEISLKNALDVSLELLRNSPLYASKEILLILSANSTCDPGDINDTIEELKKIKIKVSIVTLSCKIYIAKKITEETRGHYDLAINKEKYRDILMRYTTPSILDIDTVQSTLVPIGFPSRITNEVDMDSKNPGKKDVREVKLLCCCHDDKPSSQHYICPRCKSRNCDIPSKCGNCRLNLISAPLLARTFHYLDPVGKFECFKVNIKEGQMEEEGSMNIKDLMKLQKKCRGCDQLFSNILKIANYVSQCGRCKNYFCLNCDIYIHDSLFNCPDCT